MVRGQQRRTTVVVTPVPPPDPRPYVPSITLPCNRETAFQALHPSVLGFPMHWVEKQHVPHVREREWCAGCRLGQTPRWEGYIGVLSLNSLNRFLLRLPAAAFRESGPFRDMSDAGLLAGVIFTGYRFGIVKSRNNPAVIELVESDLQPPRPRPFPLEGALCRYWRRESLDLVDQVKRPEDLDKKMAAEFVEFAKKLNAERRRGKEAPQ